MAKGSEKGGCLNCYAARMAARNLPGHRSPTTGKPFAILRDSGPRWTGEVELMTHKLIEPSSWRKPRRIFVNSTSDLFHESLSFEDIHRVWASMVVADWHTYQILTKRASRLPEFFAYLQEQGAREFGVDRTDPNAPSVLRIPQPHIHIGVSVENQATADDRIPYLLQSPIAVRFVSYEPALGSVDFTPWLWGKNDRVDTICQNCPRDADCSCGYETRKTLGLPSLNQIIMGGESGVGARPMHLDWARSTRDQCQAAGTLFFFKQWGGWAPGEMVSDQKRYPTQSYFDGRWSRASDDWISEADNGPLMYRIGKQKAGRLLDGRTWDELPAVSR